MSAKIYCTRGGAGTGRRQAGGPVAGCGVRSVSLCCEEKDPADIGSDLTAGPRL